MNLEKATKSGLRTMLYLPLLAASLLLAVPTRASDPTAELNDGKRLLLIFAPGATDPRFTEQQRLLASQPSELASRDLLVIPLVASPPHGDASSQKPRLPTRVEQIALRKRYEIQPGNFTVILIGKDGGDKLRSQTPVTMKRLTELIDSMPMRQQEIQQRAHIAHKTGQ